MNAIEQFDALRREATKLERTLEDKLAKYQQVCTRCKRTHKHNKYT